MKLTELEFIVRASQPLRKILRAMRYTITLLLIGSMHAYAEDGFFANITVTGTVVDSSGSPLPGASIIVKGLKTGTSTDVAGKFSITVADDATLIISAVGFTTQEVAVRGRVSIPILLEASTTSLLDQVVVVGYGVQRKRDVTGSVAQVKGAELAKQPVMTATQAVQGKVSGVQVIVSGAPNSLPTVRIRGTGTMLGGANPLYVVDGVITDDIRNINNSDIVSMDILKDASATAIYGMRAANGVILITTKKGRGGKMQVNYDGNVGFREASTLVDMAGPNQYAGYLNEASVYYDTGDSLVPSSRLASGYNTDWFDDILRKGFQQNHNVAFSGGGEKINYFLSMGYISEDGILETNDFKRFTLRSNNEYKISSKLKLSALVSYSRFNLRDVAYDNFNNAYRAAPYVPSKIGDKYGNTSEAGNIGNPLLNLEKRDNGGEGNKVQGTFMLEYKPITELTLKSSMGIDLDFYRNTNYGYKYLSDTSTFITAGGNQQVARSNLSVTDNDATRWLWENTATYSKTFDKHNVTFLGGITAEEFKSNSLVGVRSDVPANEDQWYLGAGTADQTSTNNNTGDKFSRTSYLARLNYGFDDRYLLTGTFRADGTSRFSSDNRWGYFPSVGVGWILSKEKFMDNQNIFDNLKLRASFGEVGNDQVPTSLYYSLAATNIPYYYGNTLNLGIAFPNITDQDINWEITKEYDIGLDFTILEKRLSGEVDYYNKKTTDALVNVNIPGIFGDPDGKVITNLGDFRNTGVEVSLTWSDDFGKDWSYSINGNAAFNKNEIVGLNGGQAQADGSIGGQGFVTLSDNGEPIGSFYVLRTIGILQTDEEVASAGYAGAKKGDLKYEDINKDNVINSADRMFMDSYIPKITYGLNGSLNYKTFDFSFGAYGTQGSKIYNGKKATRGSDSRDNIEADEARNRWTPNNTNTSVPRAHLGQLLASSYFLESGDFFRLNNLTLGYTVPAKSVGKAKVSSLRVYLTAQNLFTITPYSGFTPEFTSSSPLNGGIELNAYPTTRTFAFGVNLAF